MTMIAARPAAASRIVVTVVVALGAVLMLLPFYWLLVASTHSSGEILSTPLLPGGNFIENLAGLLSDTSFGRAFINSVVVSVVYTVLGGLVCALAGYAFAKFDFRGRGALFGVVMVALALPSQVILVPLFQLMAQLGWLSSYQALIVPNLALPLGIFLMRQSMQAVPDEIIQAARIDGAGEFTVFFRIVMPIMKPSLAALGIFLFLQEWNDFVYPLVVQRSEDSYTIPVALASMQGIGTTDFGQLMTGTAISILPVLGLFLILQRQFVAGIIAGAVKQ